jgi:hypothetical protein
MEWADEHTVGARVEIDLDHDGRMDLVLSDSEHEGGASKSDYVLSVWLSAQDKIVRTTKFHGEWELPVGQLRDGSGLVLAFDRDDMPDRRIYRCVTAAGKLEPCTRAVAARTYDDKLAAADMLASAKRALPTKAEVEKALVTLDASSGDYHTLVADYVSAPQH